jgi:ADP-ribose pyrophosphatase
MPYTYPYPRMQVTVDAVIVRTLDEGDEVLLIERKHAPFEGCWAIPGGFVDMDETLADAAKRELYEETGVIVNKLHQLHTFDAVNRDPRDRTISTIFLGFANEDSLLKAGDDASSADWFSLDALPPLAFDHEQILDYVKKYLDMKKIE